MPFKYKKGVRVRGESRRARRETSEIERRTYRFLTEGGRKAKAIAKHEEPPYVVMTVTVVGRGKKTIRATNIQDAYRTAEQLVLDWKPRK